MKAKVRGAVTLRDVLLAQAKECREPVFARYAQMSGDNTKLRAHDAYMTALQDGGEVVVSAWDLASALHELGAPDDAAYAVESSGNWFVVNAAGEFTVAGS